MQITHWIFSEILHEKFNYNQFPGSSPKVGWNAWRFKSCHRLYDVFSWLFQEKNYFKIINLFGSLLLEMICSWFIANMKQCFSLLYAKIALIIQGSGCQQIMQICHILLDALFQKMVLFDAMLLIFIYYANIGRHLALKITEDSEEF